MNDISQTQVNHMQSNFNTPYFPLSVELHCPCNPFFAYKTKRTFDAHFASQRHCLFAANAEIRNLRIELGKSEKREIVLLKTIRILQKRLQMK